MKPLSGLLRAGLAVLATWVPAQTRDRAVPDAPPARPGRPGAAAALDPRFPTAGTILGTLPSPGSDPFALDHDPAARVLWLGDQVSTFPPAGTPNLFRLDPATGAVLSSLSVVNLMNPGPPPEKAWDGPVNGLTVTLDGTLLLNDFNGDGVILDDPLVEVSPDTGALVNSWRLDDTCPGSCLPNTNTNVPRVAVTDSRASTSIDTSTSAPPASQRVLLSSGRSTSYAVLQLTRGLPGTWFRQALLPAPYVGITAGLDWDTRLQSLWVNDRGAGNIIYEVKIPLAGGPLVLVQSFPSEPGSLGRDLAAIDAVDAPSHDLVDVGGSPPYLTRYDSGHSGARMTGEGGPPGSGLYEARLAEDPQNEALACIAAASLSGSARLALGDGRLLRLTPDAILELTLQLPDLPPHYQGFRGIFGTTGIPTPMNPPRARIDFNLPTLSGMTLHIGWVAVGGPTDVWGLRSVSPPASFVLP